MVPAKRPWSGTSNTVIKKLEYLLNDQLDNTSLSSEEICNKIGVSRSQLHRILKQETNLSLSHYVRKKRIEQAKRLLGNSKLRISEIADAVGINNHQNFTKYFGLEYGISPSKYRAKLEKEENSIPIDNQNTIAVLPFVNFSNDPDQEYFSDGMAEEIINLLAQETSLKVVGRTSAFAFKNKLVDLRTIGESLDVNYILEGSVRKAGKKVRITAQLIKVDDGYHLWSQKYDCDLTDIFRVQDEISASILEEIKDELLGGFAHPVSKRTNRDPEAYEYYLKGLHFLNKYSSTENFQKAIAYFERALVIEPDYTECLAEKASCYIQLWFFSQIDPADSVEKAQALLSKASKLDPNNVSVLVREAHLSTWHYWDIEAAKVLLGKALKIAPNNIDVHLHLSVALTYLGEYDKAEKVIQRSITLDPLSAILHFAHAWIFWYKNDLDKCKEILDELISFKPKFWGGHYLKAVVYLETGRSGIALDLAEESASLYPSSMTYGVLGQTHLLNGNFDETRKIVANIVAYMELFPVSNFDLGHLYMGLGEFEKSRDYFQKAFDAHEGRMLFLLPSCRKLGFLEKHPYFKPFFDHFKAVTNA